MRHYLLPLLFSLLSLSLSAQSAGYARPQGLTEAIDRLRQLADSKDHVTLVQDFERRTAPESGAQCFVRHTYTFRVGLPQRDAVEQLIKAFVANADSAYSARTLSPLGAEAYQQDDLQLYCGEGYPNLVLQPEHDTHTMALSFVCPDDVALRTVYVLQYHVASDGQWDTTDGWCRVTTLLSPRPELKQLRERLDIRVQQYWTCASQSERLDLIRQAWQGSAHPLSEERARRMASTPVLSQLPDRLRNHIILLWTE